MTETLATSRKVTPSAHLVLPADAPREAWLKARHAGLGSSDIAAIMGVTEYSTPLHVYYNKRGELPDDSDAGEAALWGQLHEGYELLLKAMAGVANDAHNHGADADLTRADAEKRLREHFDVTVAEEGIDG